MRIHVVLNKDGGTLKTQDADGIAGKLSDALTAHGHSVGITVSSGSAIKETLERVASAKENECIIIGGGDGSVSLAASLCWQHQKILGVIPAGTMNFFARSLQIPLELDAAIETLSTAVPSNVDIGTVNGHVFIHQVSLGIQPRMVELRRAIPYNSRLGKLTASMRAALKALLSPPSFRARLKSDKIDDNARYSILAISNNVYGEGHLPYADSIRDGVLGIYTAPRLSPWGNIRLAYDMMLGRWSDNEHFLSQSLDSINIEVLSKTAGRKMSVDGELLSLEKILVIKLHAGALKVLLPK